MYRDDIKWHEIKTIKQAWELLQQEGNVIYSGGLGINRTKSEKIRGFININSLSLKYLNFEDNKVIAGAGVSIAELIESPVNKGNVYSYICNLFSKAASTPIRNRMTIGGSIVDFPIWSDIVPALIAVNAEVTLFNGKEITVNIEEYIQKYQKELHILLNISFENNRDNFVGYSNRLTQVRFDYPALIVNITGIKQDISLNNIKVVVSGTKSKVEVFNNMENKIKDNFKLDLDFIKDVRFSADYKNKIANVYIEDGLKIMNGRVK
ncbi:MAG: FAD binding domain-containing protein [Candidatus Muirbacterium halophilum]|nr:FAD binding domain-containing protein [Candidatus Muirbacterium halophilum]MCK9474293.1 FAD binding domain-containing protein [Candidatus Muirbacterium halophilum]